MILGRVILSLIMGATAGMSALSASAQGFPPTDATVEDARLAVTFGIVPQQEARRLVSNWGPVLRFLEDHTGYRLVFQTAPDIPTFEYRLRQGEYDFAYMNPYHYTVFHQQSGYDAIAKAENKRIRGVLVVSRRSPLTHVEQFRGRDLAFPAPAAFAATLLTQALLVERQVGISPHYVGSHDAVYRAVADGRYSAGGGIMRTYLSAPADVREQLRVLTTTVDFTPHAVAVHPRVPDDIVANIQQALIRIGQDARGQDMIRGLNISGFMAARDADWDDVRALNLKTRVGR